jgi:hypothetical protein
MQRIPIFDNISWDMFESIYSAKFKIKKEKIKPTIFKRTRPVSFENIKFNRNMKRSGSYCPVVQDNFVFDNSVINKVQLILGNDKNTVSSNNSVKTSETFISKNMARSESSRTSGRSSNSHNSNNRNSNNSNSNNYSNNIEYELVNIPIDFYSTKVDFVKKGDNLTLFHRFEYFQFCIPLEFDDYDDVTVKDIMFEIELSMTNKISKEHMTNDILTFIKYEFLDIDEYNYIMEIIEAGELTMAHLMCKRQFFCGLMKKDNMIYVLSK